MHVLHVVGARPNFMKAAPVMQALARYETIRQSLVHTGQHYDDNMSKVFFEELNLPEPDINLATGPGTHAQRTARIMALFEPVVLEQRPDIVVVYGDVDSTIAVALVCAKLTVPVGHVEAGLRSFDRTMPEEINRLLTDQIADLLFTPSADGGENLLREGVRPEKIHLVGNVMIDTLINLLPKASERYEVQHHAFHLQQYGLVTLHRPSNVDDPEFFGKIMSALRSVSHMLPIIFPVHPRTCERLKKLGYAIHGSELQLVAPLSYLDFLALMSHASLVITDSGGIQEETTFLGVPCLTLREVTERPITVMLGTNVLVGRDMEKLLAEVARVLVDGKHPVQVPPLWDGKASERIARVIGEWKSQR